MKQSNIRFILFLICDFVLQLIGVFIFEQDFGNEPSAGELTYAWVLFPFIIIPFYAIYFIIQCIVCIFFIVRILKKESYSNPNLPSTLLLMFPFGIAIIYKIMFLVQVLGFAMPDRPYKYLGILIDLCL